MTREKIILALVNCERIDYQLYSEPFFTANDQRNVLLADLEKRFQKLESAVSDETINANAINSSLLFAKQIAGALVAADDAYSKAPDRGILPNDYTGSGLRKAIAQRAEQALNPGSGITLDAIRKEQTIAIREAIGAKVAADCEAARSQLEALSDDELNVRVERMTAVLNQVA